jgi:hypothetical protein
MGNIYWEIKNLGKKRNYQEIVEFYIEDILNGKSKKIHEETLEDVIGDYADQREDEWTEKQ